MQESDLPRRFPIPFANAATSGYIRDIPTPAQTASPTDAPASLEEGFPPETFTPMDSGGVPPSGADFNGILNQVTAWARWMGAGGPALFNSTFSTAIGGYPRGAQLASSVEDGLVWVSTADNNTTDPDGGSPANWVGLSPFDATGRITIVRQNINFPNGFIELSNGIHIMWGSFYAGSNTTTTFSYTTIDPGISLSLGSIAIPSGATDNNNDVNWPALLSSSASNFSVRNKAAAGTVSFIAIGA